MVFPGASAVVVCLASLMLMVGVRRPGAAQAQPSPPALATEALALIVNPRNPVESVTPGELRRIFLLQTQYWPSGRRITVVLREEGQVERDAALRAICGMGGADYARYLRQEAFRGNLGNAMPRSIRSAEGMRAFVFNAPGAVGYVRVSELDDTVKVLRVDGRLPTDPGYPFARWSLRSDLDGRWRFLRALWP